MSLEISVVVAAYDEAANIEPLTRRLAAALGRMAGATWELVFVVEGEDGTREALQRLAAELGRLRILYRAERRGLGEAFRRGFAAVGDDADYVVTLDADLNHLPEEIPRLIAEARRSGCDILVGSRFLPGSKVEGIPLWKRATSIAVNRLMSWLYGLRVRDKTSGFRVYRAAALRRLRYRSDSFAFLPELLIDARRRGYRIVEQPIHFRYRQLGRSKMGFWSTSLSYLRLLLPLRRVRVERRQWAVLALLLAGAAVRIAIAFPSHKYSADADCVLTGLAALRLLHGHPPVFFGSARLGALGSYPAACFLLLLGPTRAALAAGPTTVQILTLVVWYLFLRELLGTRLALWALPFAALPPPAFSFWTYMPNGYPEILLLCATILWLAARLAATPRPPPPAARLAATPRPPSAAAPGRGGGRWWTRLALGLALGLGFWSSPQTLACSAPAVLWLAWRRRPARGARFWAPAALGAVCGALPWLAWNLRHHWGSIHDSYGVRPAAGPLAMLDNLRYFLFVSLPQMLASNDPELGLNPPNAVQRFLHLPALLIAEGAALFALLALPFLWRRAPAAGAPAAVDAGAAGAPEAANHEDRVPMAGAAQTGPRAAENAAPPEETAARAAWPLLALVIVATAGLNLLSAAGSMRGQTVRYVLPIYLVVPALLALSLSRLAARSRLLAGLLAAVVLAANAAGTYWPWTPPRQRWTAAAAGDQRTLECLERRQVGAVLGPYWLVYPLNFLSRERILGIPLEADFDFRQEAARLPRAGVRWALAGYDPLRVARWAARAGAPGEPCPASHLHALVLPRDDSPPAQRRARLAAAWDAR
jgi:dolichol-phosphate mannosyltransferase